MSVRPSLYSRLLEALGRAGRRGGAAPSGAWIVPGTGWGEALTPDEMERVGAICPPRPYLKGEMIFRQGDPAESLHILLEGHVKISVPGPVGERVLAVCGPDDFFGESFLTRDAARHSDATCLSARAVVRPISRAQFLEVAREVPTVALAFATAVADRARALEEELQHAALPAEARLARSLLVLARRFGREVGPGKVELKLELTHEEIGSLAGTTRVTATKAMTAWRGLGLVDGTRGSYRVDIPALGARLERLELERLR